MTRLCQKKGQTLTGEAVNAWKTNSTHKNSTHKNSTQKGLIPFLTECSSVRCPVSRSLASMVMALMALTLLTPFAHAQTIAFTNATVETLTDQGRLEDATILIRGEKIIAVGTDVTVPADAKVVSLKGQTVLPGIIDPYLVFQRATQSSEVTETVTFGGRSFQIPTTRGFNAGTFDTISQHFYPQTFDFSSAIRSGITTANLVSDGRGLSGYANMVTAPNAQMLFQPSGLLFARVTNETAALDVIRTPLTPRPNRGGAGGGSREGASGQAATDARNSTNAATNTSNSNGRPNAAADSTQARWDAVREGKQTLIVNANNAATVAHLLMFLDKNPQVKVALVVTGPNVYESLDRIRGSNITLILKPELATEPFSSRVINVPKMAADRDVPFAFSLTVGTSQLQNNLDEPLYPLAALMKSGLSRQQALAALTVKPAEILGIEKQYGSIESEKYANLIIFTGDPLVNGSRLKQVIVKGSTIYEN